MLVLIMLMFVVVELVCLVLSFEVSWVAMWRFKEAFDDNSLPHRLQLKRAIGDLK